MVSGDLAFAVAVLNHDIVLLGPRENLIIVIEYLGIIEFTSGIEGFIVVRALFSCVGNLTHFVEPPRHRFGGSCRMSRPPEAAEPYDAQQTVFQRELRQWT